MENLILYLSQKLSHFIQHLYISPSSEEKTCLSFYFPWLGPTVKAESHCSVDKASLLPRPKDGKNSQTTNQHPDWFSHSQIHDLKPVASNTGLDLSGKRGNNFATFENDVRRSTCSKVNKIRMQGTNTWKRLSEASMFESGRLEKCQRPDFPSQAWFWGEVLTKISIWNDSLTITFILYSQWMTSVK